MTCRYPKEDAMRFSTLSSILVVTLMLSTSGYAQVADKPVYPQAKTVDQVDDYHGTKVADPYRWLEDLDSPETRAWIAAQTKLTDAYFDKLPERPRLKERLTKLWNYERFTAPFKHGAR